MNAFPLDILIAVAEMWRMLFRNGHPFPLLARLVLGALCASTACTPPSESRDVAPGDAAADSPLDVVTDSPPDSSPPADIVIDACSPGQLACTDGAAMSRCIDPMTDPSHCGSCDTACGADHVCAMGACVLDCTAPRSMCGDACADLQRDPNHCGTCATVCPAGTHARGDCMAGVCGSSCDFGFADCNANPADGCERDVSADDANCGGCGVSCSSPSHCVASACRTISVWSTQLHPLDIATDSSGNTYVAGTFSGTVDLGTQTLVSAGSLDGFLLALAPDGAVRWARSLGGTDMDDAYGVATSSAGNVFVGGAFFGSMDVAGMVLTSAGSSDAYVASFAPDGTRRWATRVGGASADNLLGLAVSSDGRVAIAAANRDGLTFAAASLVPAGASDALFATLDEATGAERWATLVGGSGEDFGSRVAFAPTGELSASGTYRDGPITVGGATFANAGRDDVFVVSYAMDGTIRWARALSSTDYDAIGDLVVDGSGRTYVAATFATAAQFGGDAITGAGSSDALLVALDADGHTRWTRVVGSYDADRANDVAIVASGDVALSIWFAAPFDSGAGALTAMGSHELAIVSFASDGTPRDAYQSHSTSGSMVFNAQLAPIPSGGLHVAGSFSGTVDFGTGPVSATGSSSGYVLSRVP